MRSSMMPTTMSSETRAPDSITALALRPIGVAAATAARSMSPVESCGMPYFSTSRVRLRPFAGAGRPEQDQPHLFLPLNFDLRIRPSY